MALTQKKTGEINSLKKNQLEATLSSFQSLKCQRKAFDLIHAKVFILILKKNLCIFGKRSDLNLIINLNEKNC